MSLCRRKQARTAFRRSRLQHECLVCRLKLFSHLRLEMHVALAHGELFHRQIIQDTPTQLGFGNIMRKSSKLIRPFREICAFKGCVRTYRHHCSSLIPSLDNYFQRYKSKIQSVISEAIDELKTMKSQMTLHVKFRRYLCESKSGDDVYEFQTRLINSHMTVVLNKHASLDRYLRTCASKIEHTVSIFEMYGSGWQFDSVLGCDIRVAELRPFKGGSWMEVPEEIKWKKATLNIKTRGNFCFKWAVLSCLHNPKNCDRASSYKDFEGMYDFDCISFPVSIRSIPKFETSNHIAINVFTYSKTDGLLPIQISEHNYTKFRLVNLLLVCNPVGDEFHYVGIRNIDKLLGKDNCHRRILCYNCFQRIPLCKRQCGSMDCSSYCFFDNHREKCSRFDFQKVKMPEQKNGVPPSISFENFNNQMKAGYIMYADLECLLKPLAKVACDRRKGSRAKKKRHIATGLRKGNTVNKKRHILTGLRKGNTAKKKRHIPTGFAYVVIKEDGSVLAHRVYRGKRAVDIFLQDCLEIAELVINIYKVTVPLKMLWTDEKLFENATVCHICGLPFGTDDSKCRDHNHLTGKCIHIFNYSLTRLHIYRSISRSKSHKL